MEKVLNKQRLLAVKKEEYLKKIRDLGTWHEAFEYRFHLLKGSLPGDAFEKFQSTNIKKLYESLSKCTMKLKKYRYSSFSMITSTHICN